MEYTQELFINNYLRDKEVLGEDTKYIYEEIFSSILGETITLDERIIESARFMDPEKSDPMLFEWSLFGFGKSNPVLDELKGNSIKAKRNYVDAAKEYKRIKKLFDKQHAATRDLEKAQKNLKAAEAAAKEANNAVASFNDLNKQLGVDAIAGAPITDPGKVTDISSAAETAANPSFFKKISDKVKAVFAGLKGKSFSEILASGLAWLKNPENLSKVLASAGGIALVTIILRALKKRRKLKEYKQLSQNSENLKEEYEDELSFSSGGSNFAKAKNELMNHCRINPELEQIVYGRPAKIKKENYFDY